MESINLNNGIREVGKLIDLLKVTHLVNKRVIIYYLAMPDSKYSINYPIPLFYGASPFESE